jgi:hypothetical protein
MERWHVTSRGAGRTLGSRGLGARCVPGWAGEAGREAGREARYGVRGPVAGGVLGLLGVVRPVLVGLLSGVKRGDLAGGGRDAVGLGELAGLACPGDAELDVCFKHAVAAGICGGDPLVGGRVRETLARFCGVSVRDATAILCVAGGEGSVGMLRAARGLVTGRSCLLAGVGVEPVNLGVYFEGIARAFRNPAARGVLPGRIAGVCMADLLVGRAHSDVWVAVMVCRDARCLVRARGVCLAVVEAEHAQRDVPYWDARRNLVVCPLAYEEDFMQVFYEAWRVVWAFLDAGARLPGRTVLQQPAHRAAAGLLEAHRELPVAEAVDAAILTATQAAAARAKATR